MACTFELLSWDMPEFDGSLFLGHCPTLKGKENLALGQLVLFCLISFVVWEIIIKKNNGVLMLDFVGFGNEPPEEGLIEMAPNGKFLIVADT